MSWDVAAVPVNGMMRYPETQTGWQQAQAAAQAMEKKPDAALAQKAIHDIRQFSNFLNRRLEYAISQETNQVIVKVIDGDTDKVIKVLPPEELQRLHTRIRETIGLLFDQTI